ncbi:MAG: NAD(P)-binding domain-containing protein, partial [Candidatus Aquilonibacter sp.]
MVIGIIGSDDRAVAIGRLLMRCAHSISFSDPGTHEKAQKASDALPGSRVETTYEQAAACETLIMAIHWEDLDRALAALGTYKTGVVIDATRPP